LTGELNEVLARSRSVAPRVEAAYIKAWIAGDPSDTIRVWHSSASASTMPRTKADSTT
jgi:hypothetical protein